MWTFIQDQILGMKWLNTIIGEVLLMVGLDVNSRVGGSIQFFIYDTIKITVYISELRRPRGYRPWHPHPTNLRADRPSHLQLKSKPRSFTSLP